MKASGRPCCPTRGLNAVSASVAHYHSEPLRQFLLGRGTAPGQEEPDTSQYAEQGSGRRTHYGARDAAGRSCLASFGRKGAGLAEAVTWGTQALQSSPTVRQ